MRRQRGGRGGATGRGAKHEAGQPAAAAGPQPLVAPPSASAGVNAEHLKRLVDALETLRHHPLFQDMHNLAPLGISDVGENRSACMVDALAFQHCVSKSV